MKDDIHTCEECEFIKIPCASCGNPYWTFAPEHWHRDPAACKTCYEKHKEERRSNFSRLSPGVGNRKDDV